MDSTLSIFPLLYPAIEESSILLVSPKFAWLVIFMVVVVASGLLWLLQREFRSRRPRRRRAGRAYVRKPPQILPHHAAPRVG